jgi:hypothetical protein
LETVRNISVWSTVLELELARKNVNTEAEDSVGIRHQATTGEDTVD